MRREYVASVPSDDSLYEILQVSPDARPEVIQAAYRVLARLYHPDVSQAADAQGKTRRLNAAYDVLSDPSRRASYDAFRADMARASAGRDASGDTIRSARSDVSGRSHPVDRPIGTTVFAWIAASGVGVTIVVAVLLMLWSLYDALDSPGRSAHAPNESIGTPLQTPAAPRFGATTPSWPR